MSKRSKDRGRCIPTPQSLWTGHCQCPRCLASGRRWPSIYIGSRGWSYECWLEANAPMDRDDSTMRETTAIRMGLHIVSRTHFMAPPRVRVMRQNSDGELVEVTAHG